MGTTYAALDVGGTAIKYGIVNDRKQVLSSHTIDTEAHKGGAYVVQRICHLAKELSANTDVEGIAISTAGQVDVWCGSITDAGPTMPGYSDRAIITAVENATKLPVEVENDVNCVALAEHWAGSCQKTDHFVAFTLGTGIGGAIFINGALYRGHAFSAGEWGYMPINGKGFEETASINALLNQVRKALPEETIRNGEHVFQLYDQEHPLVVPLVEAFYHTIAIGIRTVDHILNPEKIVIGGGVTQRGTSFLYELTEALKNVHPTMAAKVVLATSGNQAGMLGAVYHFQAMQKAREAIRQ
ncbi:ROK family protein [Aureibacillus halotolerans]|uniref:Putative NBD/HSP70 family sugar kinase n=1 Tax=Aureibacillus halotolerans TaxID=1508390 RepID=A0A4R6UD10_9BACI|nr:ROK family protein [Aureibacillus halotolerans]TDQ43023.1 putative NBD/HSP70 family sugar kinase [Aureibacillus halotolerans]